MQKCAYIKGVCINVTFEDVKKGIYIYLVKLGETCALLSNKPIESNAFYSI